MMNSAKSSLMLSRSANRNQRLARWFGEGFLLVVTSLSMLAVLFILIFIARDALPFFSWTHFKEFFVSTAWYPTQNPPSFGALSGKLFTKPEQKQTEDYITGRFG